MPKDILPKLFLGPMSKNVIKAVCSYNKKFNLPLGFVASRRQVDYHHGYVNGFDTRAFHNYVKELNPEIILERDHAGPLQGHDEDDGFTSLTSDCKYFSIIHIDVWKKYKNLEESALETVAAIKFCDNINNCLYEVGTEQDIRPYTSKELDLYLTILKTELKEIFNKIIFTVIQSGTSLRGHGNLGIFNKFKLIEMIDVCKKFGIRSKEHNGDYLSSNLIKEKYSLGLDAINIAPELGRLETLVILDLFNKERFESFFDLCLRSNKWKRWLGENFDCMNNKKELIEICGHYVFSTPEFKIMTRDLEYIIWKETEDKIHTFINGVI